MSASVVPLDSPSAGSANPGASLASLWAYMEPALDHIIRSPTNDNKRAPVLTIAWHMGIHSAIYNYFTMLHYEHLSAGHGLAEAQGDNGKAAISGSDLYGQLDQYYAGVARGLLSEAPEDHIDLIQYLIACFTRYQAGAQSINRMLDYVNRHYVKRAVDDGFGWLFTGDIPDGVASKIKGYGGVKTAKKLEARRKTQLEAWGYGKGGSMEQAERCAESASALEHIVPLSSLALRRFRTEFLEPLLNAFQIHGAQGTRSGRLARAVRELLETTPGGEDEKRRIAVEMADMMMSVGVPANQPLRKKLEKYVVATASI